MAGVENIKAAGRLLKFAGIAIAQEIAKDGFQPIDLLAPLKSNEFNAALQPVVKNYKELVIELSDISWQEGLDLVQGAYKGYKDLKTEIDLAANKLKSQGVKA